MASQSTANDAAAPPGTAAAAANHPEDAHRPEVGSRIHSGLDNILPAAIVKRSRSGSRSSRGARSPLPVAPLLERSVSSMTDSFMLEHWGPTRSPHPETESGSVADQPSKEEEGFMPITNWAHLSYIKTQRNHLRAELKAQQIAGTEVKRSVTSLRRLAFRMAVNISVKEKQIATSARNLANSRKGSYLQGRDAEQRIESLQRALRVEECRNAEILGALEKASMLTLEYSTPKPSPPHHSQPFSPPPSPPTRNSSLPDSLLTLPKTPTRPSAWHDFDLGLSPKIVTPREIRTSDSRLIRAKRESDQALATCRSRIEALQSECKQSRQNCEFLEDTRTGLEQEILSHQSRIASLERSRSATEETLKAAQKQLQSVSESEETLRKQLINQAGEIAKLQYQSQEKTDAINLLEDEKRDLQELLRSRDADLEELKIRIAELIQTTESLHLQLKNAERHEESLRDRLAEKEGAREDLRKRLDRGAKYMDLLEERVKAYEAELAEYQERIRAHNTDNLIWHNQLKQLQHQKKNTEEALATMTSDISSLQSRLSAEEKVRDELRSQLESSQVMRVSIAEELRTANETLDSERLAKEKLHAELIGLQASHESVKADLDAAHQRIWSLEDVTDEAHATLETLRDGKAALEADLKHARQSLFRLREEVRMGVSELADVEKAKAALEENLRNVQSRVASLQAELTAARSAEATSEQRRETEIQERDAQLRELESTVLELQRALASSTDLKRCLEQDLLRAQISKSQTEEELNEALNMQTSLKEELAHLKPDLASSIRDCENLHREFNRLTVDLEESRGAENRLEGCLTALTQESASLKAKISELEDALQNSHLMRSEMEKNLGTAQLDGTASSAKISELHNQIGTIESARNHAESRLQEASHSQSQLQRQHDVLSSRLCMVESEAAIVQTQLSKAQDEVMSLQRNKGEAEVKMETTQQSHRNLEEQVKTLETRLGSVERRAEQLQVSLTSAEGEIKCLQKDKATLGSRLAQTQQNSEKLQRELESTQERAKDVEARFNEITVANAGLQSDLDNAQSTAERTQDYNNDLKRKLRQAKEDAEALRQMKGSLEKKLEGVLMVVSHLDRDVSFGRSRIEELKSCQNTLTTKLSEANTELSTLQQDKINLEARLNSADIAEGLMGESAADLKAQMSKVEADRASLANQLSASGDEVVQLRSVNEDLEKKLDRQLRNIQDLESALLIANTQFNDAQRQIAKTNQEFEASKSEVEHFRQTNAKLENSERDLLSRLATAEDDLHIVRETNARLEAFLERVEVDMVAAEAAVAASEKRLEEFVHESQSKVDTARLDTLRYKRTLSSRNHQLDILLAENAELHQQVDEQTLELKNLKNGKEQLIQDLSDKETFIANLTSSSEKRLKSMHSAYNELRKKHKDLQNTNQHSDARNTHGTTAEYEQSVAELERKVRDLEDDKKALRRLIQTLKEKVHGLELLEEWQKTQEVEEPASPSARRVIIIDEFPHSAASSPQTQHTKSPRPDSSHSHPTSISQPSTANDRPITRQSNLSQDEDLHAWAREVERVRLRRDETVLRLKDLKKTRHDLKKSLKDTEAQLHQLEKQHSPKRHRALLRKGRPSTPFGIYWDSDHDHSGPESSPRPTTSAGVHFAPDSQISRPNYGQLSPDSNARGNTSSPRSHHRRWSMIPKLMTHDLDTDGGHVTSERPTSSHSLKYKLTHRPTSSDGDHSMEQPKDRRRWSSGLRTFFRADA